MKTPVFALCLLALLTGGLAHAQETGDVVMHREVLALENRWAEIRYEMKGRGEKFAAGRDLMRDATALAERHPGKAEPLVWEALALLVEAELRGDLSALSLARNARDLLHQAEAIDPAAANGLIQTSLGMLYYEMPSWPLGFGDKKKAEVYLTQALAIDPEGMDSNYFYGDFLLQGGRKREALPYLDRAMHAAALVRPGHERATAGRKIDIQEALDSARKAR